MQTLLVLGLIVYGARIAVSRRSPNADTLEQLMKEGRFGDNVSRSMWEDALLDFPGLLSKYGYPIEIHNVVTSDGYILEMHRVPHGRADNQTTSRKPVAFVMHGLLSSSPGFFLMGPEHSLGYLLADQGYDVWLGNARGNYYSRRHLTLDPNNDKTFWEFSWEQIGHYDLPAMIDYVLETTGQSKLHFIGHSQGGTTFLVMNSMRPEYNQKILSFQGLAPASFMIHNEFPPFLWLAPVANLVDNVAFAIGFHEVLPKFSDLLFNIMGNQIDQICSIIGMLSDRCLEIFLNQIESSLGDASYLIVVLGHQPGGASIRQIVHYGQCITSQSFSRYNFAGLGNWFAYNTWTPPSFPLSQVTAPAYIHFTKNDIWVNHNDIYLLAENLSNLVELVEIEQNRFRHESFLFATNRTMLTMVFDRIFEAMRHAENNVLQN